MSVHVRTFTDADPTDALVIVALPSTGAASPIAGQYLINALEMPLVGDLAGEAFAGLIHVEGGRPTHPVRIHGGDVACEVDGPCRRVFVVSTEIPIAPEGMAVVAQAIRSWAADARLLLVLDAVVRDEGDDTPDVWRVATDAEAEKRVAGSGAEPLKKALIGGMTAFLLAEGSAAALVVEARKDHPDGRAAAALVTALDPLIPQIKVDAEPLLKDAMDLEEQVKAAAEEAQKQAPKRIPHSFI